MNKASNISGRNERTAVRYIQQNVDEIPMLPFPNYPFEDLALIDRKVQTKTSHKIIPRQTNNPVAMRSMFACFPLPVSDIVTPVQRNTGFSPPGLVKALIFICIGIVIAAVVATAIVSPMMAMANQPTDEQITISTITIASLSTVITNSSTSTTTTITSASTSSTSTSRSTTSSTTTTTTTTPSTSTSTSTSSTSTSTRTTTSTSTSTTVTNSPSCSGWTWNATGVTVAGVTGRSGTTANLFSRPWNIFLDSNKTLYVADLDNSRIQKWLYGATSGTTVAGSFGTVLNSSSLRNPRAVWMNGNNVYVADTGNNRLQMFVNGLTSGITIASNRLGIAWVEIDNYTNIYTADMNNSIIWKNQSVFASGSSLNGPEGIAVMSNGSVLIANTRSHTVVMWNPGQSSGTVVAGTSGTFGSTSTLFHYPTSVVADNYGNFWVVDNNNHRVQFFCRSARNTTAGRTVAGSVFGASANNLNYPIGLALDSSLNLYVTDTSNHRIQRCQRLS